MSFTRPIPVIAPPDELAEVYWTVFRRHVFALIKIGHSRLDRQTLAAAHEEDITGELKREIEEWLDGEAPEWTSAYSIHEEPRVHAPDRRGKHRRRLDLRFEHTGARPRLHYEFERV